MEWTREQNTAITSSVADTIVSAAAGSGKTAVMAERIIRRLTGDDYVDIDKILVVTYTKAAASEIKERVMKKIIEKLDGGENPALSRQLIMLNNSHFCTIHSFCLDLIRKYFYKLEIDPEFGIADETEVELLKNSAVESVMNAHYNSADEVFLELVSKYSSKSDSAISEMILKVFDFSKTMPDSEAWLDSLCGFYESGGKIEEFMMERVIAASEYACKIYEDALKICAENENCSGWYAMLSNELECICDAAHSENYSDMYRLFDEIEFKRWSTPKDVSPELKKLVKDKRDDAKAIIDKIRSSYLFASPDRLKADNLNVIPVIDKIVELAKETGEIFSGLKRDKNIIDFSDFEHMALKLLKNPDGTPSDIAFQISESFEEIYIDEYQDCNNIQNAIFKLISGEIRGCPNVFCVGDMKQSIYRFRDANPLLFRHKCDTYPMYEEEKNGGCQKILLNSNFRSRKSILDFVNTIFNQIMSTTCGELEYEKEECLNYGGGFIDVNDDIDNIDIDIIDESDSFDGMGNEKIKNNMSRFETEATHVANKIKAYVSNGYMLYDKKKQITRPAEYKDIVILMRSPTKTAPIFEQVLSRNGIPVYNEKSGGYFDTEEIVFLISLLKIIDNPDDDISLAAVMKNPIFSFDENELLKIRIGFPQKNASFYSCIKNYSEENTGELSIKCSDFLFSLGKWYDKSRYMDTDSFISYLINELDYFAYLSIFADYNLRKANVRYLLQKAREFEKTNFKGIFSFIRYVENTQSVSSPETAKILSESDNVVRIMSIHHSKGLEYPIVFLSCMGRKMNKMDARGAYVVHKDYGLGIDSVYKEKSLKIQTLNRAVIKEKINLETLSEELRVLYVALTRPTEKLVLTGYWKRATAELNRLERLVETEGEKINPLVVEKCDTFMALVMLGVLRSSGCQLDSRYQYREIINDGCRYNISLINKCDITPETISGTKPSWESYYEGRTPYYPKMCSMLSYSYLHDRSTRVPGNVTVTELKRMSAQDDAHSLFDEFHLSEPEFVMPSKRIFGAQFGSLIHLIMEKIKFREYTFVDEVKAEMEKLIDSGVITESEYESVDISAIFRFFKSEAGKMMVENSDTLVREFSFKYFADASLFFDVAEGEKMIIQGTIDAYFTDSDGQLTVVDYKTDKVGDGGCAEIVSRYKVQLEQYSNALESITGKKVKNKILYLFDTGETVSV